MIEKKRNDNQSNNAEFQEGVIEKKHQTSVLVEMKKASNLNTKSSFSQKIGKIWMLLMILSMIGGLTLLFLIWRSIENLHQEIISLHQDFISWS